MNGCGVCPRGSYGSGPGGSVKARLEGDILDATIGRSASLAPGGNQVARLAQVDDDPVRGRRGSCAPRRAPARLLVTVNQVAGGTLFSSGFLAAESGDSHFRAEHGGNGSAGRAGGRGCCSGRSRWSWGRRGAAVNSLLGVEFSTGDPLVGVGAVAEGFYARELHVAGINPIERNPLGVGGVGPGGHCGCTPGDTVKAGCHAGLGDAAIQCRARGAAGSCELHG